MAMTEGSEKPTIEIAGKYSTVESLKERARGGREDRSEAVFERIAKATEQTAQAKEKEEAQIERLETPSTPEGWVSLVFGEIDKMEREAGEKRKRSDEDPTGWVAIDRAILRIPDRLGEENEFLSKYLARQYPEGVYLREKLQIYFNARKHLMNRYIEINRSGGSLTGMGLGREDVPFEGITYGLERIAPVDWWAIIHGDEMFPEALKLSDKEQKEVLPNVDEALSIWWKAGVYYGALERDLLADEERELIDKLIRLGEEHDEKERKKPKEKQKLKNWSKSKWPGFGDVVELSRSRQRGITEEDFDVFRKIPTFKGALNNAEVMGTLRARIQGHLKSRKAEELAFEIFTTSLTNALFDRDQIGLQGKSQDRNLIHIDRKRVEDFLIKEREPGVDWTIGCYFAPYDVDATMDRAGRREEEKGSERKKMERRRATLKRNAERSVFQLEEGYDYGQLVSDLFHTITVKEEDEDGNLIDRKLISWAVDNNGNPKPGGWKEIPFYKLGPESYAGYFGYSLTFANMIKKEITAGGHKVEEELIDPSFWAGKKGLLDRLGVISPWFNTAEYGFRGFLLRQKLKEIGEKAKKPIPKGQLEQISNFDDIQVVLGPKVARRFDKELDRATREGIKKEAKKRARRYEQERLHKLRMVYATGVLWDGSLDRIEGVGGMFASSRFSPGEVVEILRAIQTAGFVSGEYYEQLKYEAIREMGFGERFLRSS